MSLKAFHFAFICICILLTGYFGGWCVQDYADNQTRLYLLMGIGSFVATAALIVYLAWFLKKSKNVGFLVLAAALSNLFISNSAQACAVCFGNSSHPLAKAANSGVWFLLVVVSVVLVAFAALFISWGVRSRRLEPRG